MSLPTIPQAEKDVFKIVAVLRQAIEAVNSATPGDVTGPASATDNAAARFDGTTGKLLQDSPLIIADTTGALSRSGGGGIPIQGTNTNATTAAGNVGEPVSSTIASGSAVSLTSTNPANITSISLAAGNWLVFGIGYSNPSLGNATQNQCSISTTSATHQGFSSGVLGNSVNGTAATNVMNTGVALLSLPSTTTVYLVFSSIFPSGTNAAHGTIAAIRLP